MDTVKRGLNRLRAGFVLPMSLVTTVITLLLVSASATYCTTQFRTSQLYLSRTRCRLVAQSAIEMTKLALVEKCGGELTSIGDPANPNFSIASLGDKIDAVMTEVKKPEFAERIPGVGPNMSVAVNVKQQDSGPCRGYVFIYATAEHKQGGRSTTVTLQEMLKIPVSSGSIFDYAYFANHDGHLTSQYMVINGDVRANEDFYITGAEINGYVYASNTVHLATEKNRWGWWDNQDPCIRSMDSYNSMYRRGSTKEFSTYAKARPTNPLMKNGQAWVGGFEAVDATQETGESMPSGLSYLERLLWIWTHGGTGGKTTTLAAPTLTGKIKPSDSVPEAKEDFIINALAVHDDDTHHFLWFTYTLPGEKIDRSPGVLKMPQIAWTDAGLKQYKDYSATATTVKGKTGGSLICSNCFVNADGKIEQLSAKVNLSWNGKKLVHYPETPAWDEEVKGAWNETVKEAYDQFEANYNRAATMNYVPPNGVLVYDCLEAKDYALLSVDEKKKWYRIRARTDDAVALAGEQADTTDGTVGVYTGGYVGKIKEGTHAGTTLFFDETTFNAKLGTEFSESQTNAAVRAKFEDDGWKLKRADYDDSTKIPHEIVKGTEVMKTWWVPVYYYTDSWLEAGLLGCQSYSDVRYVSSSSNIKQSELEDYATQIATAYGDKGITKAMVTEQITGGWTKKGGYSSRSATGYYAFSVVRHYETGKADWYELASKKVDNQRTAAASDSYDKDTTYTTEYAYKGYYYSSEPLGYIRIDPQGGWKDEYDVAIGYDYVPFASQEEKTYTKFLETKLVPVYTYYTSYKSGRTSIPSKGSTWYRYTSWSASDFNNLVIDKAAVDAIASDFKQSSRYGSAADDVADEIRSYLTGDWSSQSGGYRGNSASGYLAINLYGTYTSSRKELELSVQFGYMTVDEAKNVPAVTEKVVDLWSVPVYTLDPGSNRTKLYGTWYQISGSGTGYFNGKILESAAIDEAGNHFEEAYDLPASEVRDFVLDYFKGKYSTVSTGKTHYRSNNPSGYLVIKLLWTLSGTGEVSHQLKCEYSSTPQVGSGPDKKTETVYIGSVPDGCIPVYEYASYTAYNSKTDKENWVSVPRSGGYYNSNSKSAAYNRFFLPDDLDAVAQTCVSEYGTYGVTKADVVNAISGKDGWNTGKQTSGYYSRTPRGYIRVDIDVETTQVPVVTAKYTYLSVTEGEVGKDIHHEAEVEHHDAEYVHHDAVPAHDEPVDEIYSNKTVTRELRRIFVKDGYKIDATARLYDGTGDEDLVLTRNVGGGVVDKLTGSSTTADLRPFREGDGFEQGNGNKMTKDAGNADKGAVILIGTWDFPIVIDGPVVFESDVIIRGFVSGRGTIYSGRNIHVIGDINYKNPPYWPDTGNEPETKGKDMLVLISRGSIVFGNYVKANDKDPMDDSWSGTDSLLSGNYINGLANSDDKTSKWGKNDAAVPYVSMNYTQSDTKGGTKYKLVYDNGAHQFTKTAVKYYESVVGDYVFISKNNSGGTAPDEASSLSTYGCSSRLAQTWDLGFGTTAPSSWQKQENFLKYACYQSKVLDAYAKHKSWGEAERVGLTTRKTMSDLWTLHRTDLQNFYITKQSDGYGGYGGDSKSQAEMADIQDVNAVLYSSMGIFGIVGGQYSPVTINGAVIGQDEALFPYTQYQAKRKHWWQWWVPRTRTETSNLALTINWDIRLNLKSTESRRNQESDEQSLSAPITVDETSSGNANDPRILSWQEVPDSFNEEYHATP